MNIEVYKSLRDVYGRNAYMLMPEELYENPYEKYVADNYKLVKEFLKESTVRFYNLLWECFAELYGDYTREKKVFDHIGYSLPLFDSFNSYFISKHDDLVVAVEEYIEEAKPNLKFHNLDTFDYSYVYDEDLLLQMLTLDGITYELGVYKNTGKNYLLVRITKEKIEEHINKALELCRWLNRDGEDEEKRQVLLRRLNN